MRTDGLIFMLLSWGAITGALVFCLARTLRARDERRDEEETTTAPDKKQE